MSKITKFGSEILFSLIIFEIYFLTLFSGVSSEIKKPTCQLSGLTLECNYIPQEIPRNVTVVKIIDWLKNFNSESSPSERICDERTFQSNTWKKVQILEIDNYQIDQSNIPTPSIQLQSKCFSPLKELQQLHLHSKDFHLSENAFVGLENVRLLDFTGCSRLKTKYLNKALKGSNKVPNLTEISMSQAGYITVSLQLDEEFADAIGDKPVKKIHASDTQITFINLTAITKKLKYLEYFNASHTVIGYTVLKDLVPSDIPQKLGIIDVSYATLPSDILFRFPGQINFLNGALRYNPKKFEFVNMLLSIKTLNLTGIFSDQTSLWFENFTIFVNTTTTWKVEEFIWNKNNFRRMNCTLVFGNNNYSIPSLTKLAISDNLMEFIHPSLLAIASNLQILDMSRNNLKEMAKENYSLFETLLNSLKQLKNINLSNNGLNKIPSRFFEANINLEIIDLSNNDLDLVTFDLQTLKHLQELNLGNNKIVRLNQDSLNNLNKLLTTINDTLSTKLIINLNSNPVSCVTCEDQNSIDWLLRATKLNLTNQHLQCQQENGRQEKINEATLGQLQKLCQREVIILVSTLTTGFVFLVVIILSFIIYNRRKALKQKKNRAAILNRLQDGENMYEFVAFLGYSSNDEHFVNTYVINQMNETLQQLSGINRNLVCTGDQCFRPGRMVHDEIVTCLERVCVMVVLISDSYCSSTYCCSEFDQAHLCQKPIILMLHGEVDENMMSPAMKQLYRRNTRILWSEENGEYVLKTSWENVCSSILDIIK